MSRFSIPHAGWWIAVLGGLALLGTLAFSPAAHAAWLRHAPMFPRPVLEAIFAVAMLLHVLEGRAAYRLARRLGVPVLPWTVQTFLLGFPSLRLLRRLDDPGRPTGRR